MGSAWSSDRYSLWSFQDAKAKGELLRQRQIPIWMMEPLRGGRLAALSQEEDGAPLRGLRSSTVRRERFSRGEALQSAAFWGIIVLLQKLGSVQ